MFYRVIKQGPRVPRPLGAEVLKFDGAFAPRILRFDGPYGPKGSSGAIGPLRGPGSEGSKGSARLQRAGSEGCGAAPFER